MLSKKWYDVIYLLMVLKPLYYLLLHTAAQIYNQTTKDQFVLFKLSVVSFLALLNRWWPSFTSSSPFKRLNACYYRRVKLGNAW